MTSDTMSAEDDKGLNVYSGTLVLPVFSHRPGFYYGEFELAIDHPDQNATIHYTLDGSEPTTESPVYSGPVTIRDRSDEANDISEIPTTAEGYWSKPAGLVKKATVIRAIAVKPGFAAGNVQTGTYFIDQQGAERYSFPVISIVTDRDNFFDEDAGIYVEGERPANFLQRGREWERPVHIELFGKEGQLNLGQDAGVRIHGGTSRLRPQKSLRLYARREYGDNRFYHQVFPDQHYTAYNRLLLRNSGNDASSTMFRDALAQSLIRDFNVETQAYRPVVVFLNGEYWGIHNMRERYDRHYLARVYDIDPDNIDFLSYWIFREVEIDEGDDIHYKQMLEFLELGDLNDDELFEQVREWMDIDHYLDYCSAQIYFGNYDWPHNNIDFWRLRTPYDPSAPEGHDGLWRWLLYDADFAFGLYRFDFDMIEWVTRSHWSTVILRNLLENERFRHQFINRIADHLNSAFLPERVLHFIDSLGNAVKPEISEHIERWGSPASVENWTANVEAMRLFASRRPESVRQHLMTHFKIEDQMRLVVDVSDSQAGTVYVNQIDISAGTPGMNEVTRPWVGTYFQNIPVKLMAGAFSGFEFSHWEGAGNDAIIPEIVLPMKDSTSVKAVFIRIDDEDEETAGSFRLYQNYPNPFNPETVIRYRVPADVEVRLDVFDILGKRVAMLTDEHRRAGTYQVNWNASGFASGLYIYRLTAGDFSESMQMMLIK